MHRGVQALIQWLENNPVDGGRGASAPDVASVTETIASPLPTDLRLLLAQLDGGELPTGLLLSATGEHERSIRGGLQAVARTLQQPVDDPELPLPFFSADDDSVLCFDRSAGPVADTWPVVDVQPEGQVRLVHRTFDGWCRLRLAEWTADDFGQDFSLDSYLAAGRRHVAIEPDVAVAHATVAHALRRAGEPERALESYERAARCVPSEAWCDWEALKLATLLDDTPQALTSARRLSARAPRERWALRETTPGAVADALSVVAQRLQQPDIVLRLLDQLAEAADGDDAERVATTRHALHKGEPMRPTSPPNPTAVSPHPDPKVFWANLEKAYRAGAVRDDDLLLDPMYRQLESYRPLKELLRIRREF